MFRKMIASFFSKFTDKMTRKQEVRKPAQLLGVKQMGGSAQKKTDLVDSGEHYALVYP